MKDRGIIFKGNIMDSNVPGDQGQGMNQSQGTGNQSSQSSNPAPGAAPSGGEGMKKEFHGILGQLEAILDEYMVEKAPFQLPMNVKEIIAKVAPYLILVLAVFAIPAIIAALGITAVLTPVAMMGGYQYGPLAMIGAVIGLVALVVELMAVPGLFKRTHKGWRLAFYASLISLVGSVFSYHPIAGLISGLIGAIIGWYLLFQIKVLYKN